MSTRFHNKNHRFSHHTTKTTTIPDAGYDPVASHESPFLGDFVLSAGRLSSYYIDTNVISPFSGNIIDIQFPNTLRVSNLSAVSATINQINILVSELSGFYVQGIDNTLNIPTSLIYGPGANNVTMQGVGISATQWCTIDGDLQTKRDLYVSGMATINNEFVTNLTGVNNYFTNEHVINSNITNLTATNLSGFETNFYNSNITNLSISNCLSTDCINSYTLNNPISVHSNINMLGNSISGLGNNSLTFESGLKIGSDSSGRFNLNAYSVAETLQCSASGQYSHAEGYITIANGIASHTEGNQTSATNIGSHAEGAGTLASGGYSHAEGNQTIASGDYSHAEGEGTVASGIDSHAGGAGFGNNSIVAEGTSSFAHGRADMIYPLLVSRGKSSLAFGYGVSALNDDSYALGRLARAEHDRSFVWSSSNSIVKSTNSDQFTVYASNGIVLGNGVDITGSLTLSGQSIQQWGDLSDYISVSGGSGGDEAVNTLVHTNSSNWDGVYTTVQTNSGGWVPGGKITTSLTYSPTAITDLSTGDIFTITLTGNIFLDNPINGANGSMYLWRIKQDGVGSHTIGLGSKFKIPSSATTPLAWSTAASAMDIFSAECDTVEDKFYVVSMIPGY